MDVKKYNRIKLWLSITSSALFFLIIFIITLSGIGELIESWLISFINSDYIRFVLFVIILSIITSFFTSPISFYSDYILEHKYGLSNLTLKIYLLDKSKSLGLSLLIGVPILLLFHYLLKNFPDNWWIFFSAAMFFISVVLAQIFAIFILPIFYKLKQIKDEKII